MEPKTTTVVLQDILDAIDGLREATMTAYPGYLDLPEWEPAYLLLEEKLCLEVLESENFEVTFNLYSSMIAEGLCGGLAKSLRNPRRSQNTQARTKRPK